jgi:hypothetical protein
MSKVRSGYTSFAALVTFSCLTASFAPRAFAQAPAAGSNWQHVQQLPPNTHVHVAGDHHSGACKIEAVTDDALICSGGRRFARPEIKSIKLTRHGLSALAGAGIGAGVGFAAGAGVAHGSQGEFTIVSNQDVWAAGALAGGVIGAVIGAPTDFARGPTVYRR